jgi:hypothetical protein
MKNSKNLEITELILVNPKNDWSRTFTGTIVRKNTDDGQPFVFAKVIINEGKIWSSADCEKNVINNLDEICTLKLDCELHKDEGITTIIADKQFFLN